MMAGALTLMIAATAFAASRPQTYVIGLDLSQSNPLVKDRAYAARAAARAAKEIAALPLKSRVMLRTFGSYDTSANGLKIDQVISSHARPEAVAQGIAQIIANVPKLVAEGKLTAQGKTNIVPFLDTMSQVVDCAASDVHVVLLTDGFEDSEYAPIRGAMNCSSLVSGRAVAVLRRPTGCVLHGRNMPRKPDLNVSPVFMTGECAQKLDLSSTAFDLI